MMKHLNIYLFDAQLLYNEWRHLQVEMVINISNHIVGLVADEPNRAVHFMLRGSYNYNEKTRHSYMAINDDICEGWYQDMCISKPEYYEFDENTLFRVEYGKLVTPAVFLDF